MMFDIAALQRIYGANFTFNAGDSIYSWERDHRRDVDQRHRPGRAWNGGGGSQNRVFMTIWDGGGNDTYDLSNYSDGVTIDLRPGRMDHDRAARQLANLGGGHFARGNIANALLYEGNTASLIENAIGGSGDDTLIANQAANQLTGNGGADTFMWYAAERCRPRRRRRHDHRFPARDRQDRSRRRRRQAGTAAMTASPSSAPAPSTMSPASCATRSRAANLRIQGDFDGNGICRFRDHREQQQHARQHGLHLLTDQGDDDGLAASRFSIAFALTGSGMPERCRDAVNDARADPAPAASAIRISPSRRSWPRRGGPAR